MNVEVRVQGGVDEALSQLKAWLVGQGFAFMETDRSFRIDASRQPGTVVHVASAFWARKQLGGALPTSHALEVVGEVCLADEAATVRSRIAELHGQREHTYGGAHALEDFVKAFCAVYATAPASAGHRSCAGGTDTGKRA